MRAASVKPATQAARSSKPDHVVEIVLNPGDFYFGGANTRIRTLLGSCVSITMWHPLRLIGGMCHYMLPSRNVKRFGKLDGRYADEAMLMFFQAAVRFDTDPGDYIVKLFGGGNMFPHRIKKRGCADIAHKNAEAALVLTERYGFKIAAQNMGGSGHRQVVFDIWSGDVWVRQVDVQHSC